MIPHNYSPDARRFRPDNSSVHSLQKDSTLQQVSSPPSPYLEARLLNLEIAHADLRDEVDTIKDLYHDLCESFGKVKTQAQKTDLTKSRQSAMHFKKELEQLSRQVRESVNGDADELKTNSKSTPKANGSVPPHARPSSVNSHGSGQMSLPPHLRGGKQSGVVNGNSAPQTKLDPTKHKHEPLVTDGPIDTIVRQSVPVAALNPPRSPTTTVQGDAAHGEARDLTLADWKPHYLTTLESLPADIRARIPVQQNMATFSFDVLQNLFDGVAWSPGLRYINTTAASLLKNRTYYLLDPKHEPYLPKRPGDHGAKLTAFFNIAPEEEFDNLPEGTNSYTDVPMFIQVSPGRYAYFGNYSQTRWSDKLDNDTMKVRVPQAVKEHIAKDLAAAPREEWVTRELKKHFFPKPQYEGTIFSSTSDDTTVNTVAEEQHNEQVADDVKAYIRELTEWEREANMKTAMIKSDFILNAFGAADADDPPALRLWWEYLECVDWKVDFYNMLVGIQARSDTSK